MSLFGKIVRTVVNTVELPVAIAKDVLTLGGTVTERNPTGHGRTYTGEQLQRLKDEAD